MRNAATERRIILTAILLAFVLLAIFAFRGAGRWLVREDSLSHADVIFVLSGSMPYRAEEAANVYRQGYAPEVWLSHPQSPADDLSLLGIHYVAEEEYNRDVLVRDGVPKEKIRILPQEIANTEQELAEAREELGREGKSSIIIVTSPEHTRRVRAVWRALFGRNSKAMIHAAPEDPFDADHWWQNTRDALAVSREILGLLNAWAGLPIRPHSS